MGAPPHGGFALGIDRFIALLAGESNIRDVTAFPKTASGSDPMTGAPAPATQERLDELGITLKIPKSSLRNEGTGSQMTKHVGICRQAGRGVDGCESALGRAGRVVGARRAAAAEEAAACEVSRPQAAAGS